MKQKRVWLMCGPPGAGKSTWAKRQLTVPSNIWHSRDVIRFLLVQEDEEYFSKETEVVNLWTEAINASIEHPAFTDIYVDATHLNPKARRKIINRLNLSDNISLCAVNFLTSLDKCLQQNSQRIGREIVPEEVLKNMYNSFIPASKAEGFSTIINIGGE